MTGGLRSWTSEDGLYRVQLAGEVWNQILDYCPVSMKAETGGILIGFYSDDLRSATITEVTPPPHGSKGTFSTFKRGIKGLWVLLIKRWHDPNRTFYIGEWHYHPSDTVEPSFTDLHQMEDISNLQQFQCAVPIMLIIGRGRVDNRQSRLFIFSRGKSMLELKHQRDVVAPVA